MSDTTRTLIERAREAHASGDWDRAVAEYEAALTVVPPEEREERCDLLRWSGTVHRDRGDLEAADALYRASLEVAEAHGLADREAAARVAAASLPLLRGEHERAAERFLEAREASAAAGDDRLVAMCDQNLGIVANIRGNVALALLSYRSALEGLRRAGDERAAVLVLNNMGMAHVDLGEWEAAEDRFAEAAAEAERLGDPMQVGLVELNRSELHLKRRRWRAARDGCERALRLFHRLRARRGIAEAYKFLGVLYRQTGRAEQADTHFSLSLGLAETCGDRLLQAETRTEWAVLHLEEERVQEGIVHLNRALALFRDMQARREVLDVERRLERLRTLYLPAVGRWSARLSEGDPHLCGHAARVADHAARLAEELELPEEERRWIRLGALLHDVGNDAVPDGMLARDDALAPHEREIVQVHTIMGDSLVAQLGFPDEVRPAVRSHHERWDGGGYPDGLAGEKIPLAGRIVGIAEVWDALTTPRSFRPAYAPAEALSVMEAECDGSFDPEIFRVFRDMVRRGGDAVR